MTQTHSENQDKLTEVNMSSKEIESNVYEYLQANKIEVSFQYIGEVKKDDEGNWNCDRWSVYITKYADFTDSIKHAKSEGFTYSTGLGLRKNNKPKPPEVAGVIFCLILDSQAYDLCFEQWADEFGYDTDSRKAEKIYNLCLDNAKKLRKVLSNADIVKLQELTEGY